MRLLPFAAPLAIVLVGAPAAAAAVERNPLPNCAANGSRTLAVSKDARIYWNKAQDTVWACAQRTNRRLELGAKDECAAPRVFDFRFGKRVLAYVEHKCTFDFGEESITVLDLPGLRTVRRVRATTARGVGEFDTAVPAWALKPNGALAWAGRTTPSIVNPDPPVRPPRYQVWRAGAGDPPAGTMLDEGDDIDPASLALAAAADRRTGESILYWRRGGQVATSVVR